MVFDALAEISGGSAQGYANFTFTCAAGGSDLCSNNAAALTFSGTVPFTFTVLPADS
jgi:hypothetical protein